MLNSSFAESWLDLLRFCCKKASWFVKETFETDALVLRASSSWLITAFDIRH